MITTATLFEPYDKETLTGEAVVKGSPSTVTDAPSILFASSIVTAERAALTSILAVDCSLEKETCSTYGSPSTSPLRVSLTDTSLVISANSSEQPVKKSADTNIDRIKKKF